MGRIRTLPDYLVSLISAGEVIENPSSVVKELVENSLDAGASDIEILIENGGIDRVRVSDNGSGMLREDVPLSIGRHTTSKISTEEDIDSISTYGFRGEALASIAAVADLRIETRSRDEEIGCTLTSRLGKKATVVDSARQYGTTVEVTRLFSEIPARRKHLAGHATEGLRVIEAVTRHAVVRNDVGFHLTRDGENVVDCPAGQTPRSRVISLWGAKLGRALVEISYTYGNVHLEGFVARPPVSRGNRGREYFSVLKRPVQDSRFSTAVEAAFATLLMRGRYPVCCIDITTDLKNVDANVHPTKREVRLVDTETILDSLKESVRSALQVSSPPETGGVLKDFVTDEQAERPAWEASTARVTEERRRPFVEVKTLPEDESASEEHTIDMPVLGGPLRIIGQLNGLYILLESDDGLVIVDQHAAHERVMYERLRKQVNSGRVVVQELLEPLLLRLDASDAERILSVSHYLEEMGFAINPFGRTEVLVSAYPEVLGRQASEQEMIALIDEIVDIGPDYAGERFMDELVKVTACHSAIRAGQELSYDEIGRLLEEMTATPNRYNCPHGRPTLVRLNRRELDSRFGRT